MIRVFAMNAADMDFSEPRWERYLSQKRKNAAQDRKWDRQLFLGAEALMNRALEQTWGDLELPAAYGRNEHGKPYLKPPYEDRFVNWSHSGGYVLCAVADREVGVDLQEMRREPSEALMRKLLSEEERRFYESQAVADQKRVFYEYWTLKESFLKALGTGFATELSDFYIGRKNGMTELVQRVNEKKYSCGLLAFPAENYAAAVCLEGAFEIPEVEIVT